MIGDVQAAIGSDQMHMVRVQLFADIDLSYGHCGALCENSGKFAAGVRIEMYD